MINTKIYRDLVSLFEAIDAEVCNRSTLDGMRALEDLMRAGDDVIMQGRAEDLDALIVIDVLRGYFATWYERLQKVREEEIEQERIEAEQYWYEEGRYLEREQAEADLLEFRHGE
jgi:hypothetical protein